MTRRNPAAFLAVCAMHLGLAWTLLVPGSGHPTADPAQPARKALAVVPVSFIATARPAPAVPMTPRTAAARDRQANKAATPLRPAAAMDAPAPAAEAPWVTGSEVQRPDTLDRDPIKAAVAMPVAKEDSGAPAANADAVPASAAAPVPAQARADPASVHPAPRLVAQADRQRCPAAPHPAALRERGIEGAVVLRVKVDAQGRPADVQVQSGSGWRLFDEAALQQARACRFIPATQGGQAIDSWVEFPVRFALVG